MAKRNTKKKHARRSIAAMRKADGTNRDIYRFANQIEPVKREPAPVLTIADTQLLLQETLLCQNCWSLSDKEVLGMDTVAGLYSLHPDTANTLIRGKVFPITTGFRKECVANDFLVRAILALQHLTGVLHVAHQYTTAFGESAIGIVYKLKGEVFTLIVVTNEFLLLAVA